MAGILPSLLLTGPSPIDEPRRDSAVRLPLRSTVAGGAVPDQLVFTADGPRLLAAIEGEPGDNYSTGAAGGMAVTEVAIN